MITVRRKVLPQKNKTTVSSTVVSLGRQSSLPAKNNFFQFSQKVDYGFFLLAELAQNLEAEPMSLRTLAEKNSMSFFFLQRVALDLRRAGIIESSRGKNGGYSLSQNPKKISLKEVIEALEGPCVVTPCLHQSEETTPCIREKSCRMREGMNYINTLFTNILFQTTLSDFITMPWKKSTH